MNSDTVTGKPLTLPRVGTCPDLVDMRDDTGPGGKQRFTYRSHERSEHVDIVAWRDDYDNGDRKAGKVLLILKVTVNSQEYIELRCRQLQQVAVLDASSSDFSYGLDFVLREFGA